MKLEVHPEYHQVDATCVCGHTMSIGSTKSSISVEICENCHPFYTGQQKIIDTEGRVERFKKRLAGKVVTEVETKPVLEIADNPSGSKAEKKKKRAEEKEAEKQKKAEAKAIQDKAAEEAKAKKEAEKVARLEKEAKKKAETVKPEEAKTETPEAKAETVKPEEVKAEAQPETQDMSKVSEKKSEEEKK